MKILLIGAGYVGSELLKKLSSHEIVVTTTDKTKVDVLKRYAKGVVLISDDNSLDRYADDFEALILLVAPKNGQSYAGTYLKTAQTVISLLKKRLKPCYLLYTSSTSVYEDIGQEWATEALALVPDGENAKILLETEKTLLAHPLTCILRLGGIFGPMREISKRALAFSGKELAGDGSEPTNNVHLSDIVAAIKFCIEKSLTGIYNLVSNEHPTRRELYDKLSLRAEIPGPIWNPALPQRKKTSKACNKKILEAGFTPSMHSVWE